MAKQKRIRATADPGTQVGQERYQLYREAFEWINKSIDEGYYLEAISLIESLLADRLESRVCFITRSPHGFKTLGPLINDIRSRETDPTLRQVVTTDVNQWREDRNKAAHEMVKIEPGKKVSWTDRVAINKQVAKEGLRILHKIHDRIRQLKPE